MKETNGNVGMGVAMEWEIWSQDLDLHGRPFPKKKLGSSADEEEAYEKLAEFRRQGLDAHIVPPGFSPYDMR